MKKVYFAALILVIILSLPILLWYLEPGKKLQIAIIDKTVPNETYREHLGITWLLNYLKYKDNKNHLYKASDDYFGFVPEEKQKSYHTRPLPSNYDKYDVIYLADTYGVYREDLPWVEKSREGARSEKIYGGLQEKEWNAIIDRLNKKKKSLLVAEYNTFASPTNEIVRKNVTDYLGVDWSGWTGRYFDELDPEKNKEVPKWIVDEYQDSWKYKGEGFILVNDFTQKVVVLEMGKHMKEGGISLSFTKEGKKLFGLENSPNYRYWFDIVTPKQDVTTLANYKWNLTADGKSLLRKNNIPDEFAAVIAGKHGSSTSYYFAGDFNDVLTVPQYYQIKGIQKVYKLAQKYSDSSFYWSAYLPMMESILEEYEKSKNHSEENRTAKIGYNARIKKDSFEVFRGNKWVPITIKGVNIGMGKPGSYPGEAAITEEEYYRWFTEIGKMHANTIRVYTLHPPGFYNALKRYNDNHKEKIYVLHGVWIDEEPLDQSKDAFEKKNLQAFQNAMKTTVDVIHGNKIVKPRTGHASGVYRADISKYVIGWILGIEWDPFMVQNTNKNHSSLGDYNGQYFETKNAKPFEYWLASQMDTITKYEVENYHWIRPMSFTNWVTTDILKHPSDSTGQEDIVSVNPNVIYTKNEMNLTKEFASYHIYPYYPDFLNYDKKYQKSVNRRGQLDNYAGYLADLHQVHRIPILVAEFGVPSSRGLTHKNIYGMDQGNLSEKQQGEILSHLFKDISDEKLLGGLIFTWQDEWFKRTWNTLDYDNPDRRPFWSNAQTNEQEFGLLSFDQNKIQVDGNTKEWKTKSLYEKKQGDMKALYVNHDEKYLYIRLNYNPKSKGYPIFLLDVIPNQGNHFIKGNDGIHFANGVDFLINLNKKESRVEVDDYYDFFTYQYGHQLKMIHATPELPQKDSGEFSRIYYALNKPYYIPDRGITLPFSKYETGKLKEGNGNPASKNYNSLADYSVNEKDGVMELRIPWLLIQAKDPSQKEFTGDIIKRGMNASAFIDKINIGTLYFDDKGSLTDTFPSSSKGNLLKMEGYTWSNWNKPVYTERLKQSYFMVKDLFSKYQ